MSANCPITLIHLQLNLSVVLAHERRVYYQVVVIFKCYFLMVVNSPTHTKLAKVPSIRKALGTDINLIPNVEEDTLRLICLVLPQQVVH